MKNFSLTCYTTSHLSHYDDGMESDKNMKLRRNRFLRPTCVTSSQQKCQLQGRDRRARCVSYEKQLQDNDQMSKYYHWYSWDCMMGSLYVQSRKVDDIHCHWSNLCKNGYSFKYKNIWVLEFHLSPIEPLPQGYCHLLNYSLSYIGQFRW